MEDDCAGLVSFGFLVSNNQTYVIAPGSVQLFPAGSEAGGRHGFCYQETTCAFVGKCRSKLTVAASTTRRMRASIEVYRGSTFSGIFFPLNKGAHFSNSLRSA